MRTYADIPNNHLSSNTGLFAQEHRHMDLLCVCTQIFLIIICLPMLDYLRKNIDTWIYYAYVRRYS